MLHAKNKSENTTASSSYHQSTSLTQGGLAPRYFMVGVYTLPVKEGEALVESLQEMGGGREPGEREDLRQRGDELLRADREGEVQRPEIHPQGQKESSEDELERLILGEDKPKVPHGQEDLHDKDGQGEQQPVIFVDREAKEDEVLPEALIRDLDIKNKQWEEYVQDLSDVRIQNITMAVPLRSRNVNDITRAVSYFYAKVKSLGLPLHRIHSDRAKEFVSKKFAAWVSQRDLMHTTTAGDEHQGCARVEGEIGHLKNRVRGGAPMAIGIETRRGVSIQITATQCRCPSAKRFALWCVCDEQGEEMAF